MRRLMTKFWKEIAYLVGLFGLGLAQVSGFDVETFGVLYTGAGLAMFVLKLLRNNDPRHEDDGGYYGIGSTMPSGLQHMRRFHDR